MTNSVRSLYKLLLCLSICLLCARKIFLASEDVVQSTPGSIWIKCFTNAAVSSLVGERNGGEVLCIYIFM